MATVISAPSGAVLCSGRGLASVQAHVQRSFEEARALGPTTKVIQQVAAEFVREIENQRIGEGLEIIEEKKPAIPLKPLVDRAAPILERLARTPILRKHPNTNVWNIEEVPDAPETLFEAALTSLGYSPAHDTGAMTGEIISKKKWWER